MKFDGLKEIAEKGGLIIHRYFIREYTRRKYIYSDEPDICDQKLIKVEKIKYKRYFYFARTKEMPPHKNFKITGQDFKELKKSGAIEEF